LQTRQMTLSGVRVATLFSASPARAQQHQQITHPAASWRCRCQHHIRRSCPVVPTLVSTRRRGICTDRGSDARTATWTFAAVACRLIIGAFLVTAIRSTSKSSTRLALSALVDGARSHAWRKCGGPKVWQVRAVAATRVPISKGFHLLSPVQRKNAGLAVKDTKTVATFVVVSVGSRRVFLAFILNAERRL